MHTPAAVDAPSPELSAVPGTRSLLRRVYLAQAVGSTIDGIALSTAVLYFSAHVGLPAGRIGVILGVAAICALVLVVPLGVLADRIGLRRAAVGLCVLVAAALATYALAHQLWVYAVGAILFVVAQAGIGAVRQAIVAANVDAAARVRGRAVLHTLLNAGMGAGTVIGTLVALPGSDLPFVVAFAAGSVAALGCAAIFAALPATGHPAGAASAARRPGLIALRDRRFVGIAALAAILQLTMPVLSVLLPLWITVTVHAPTWTAPAAIGLNTLLVLLTQTAWAARIRTDGDAGRSTALAACGLALGCTLYGLAATTGPAGTVVLLIGGTLVLTAGEVAGGAGTWHLAFSRIPTTSPGQYQAVFGMSGSVARILGPLLALPLVLAVGTTGWIILGLVMAAAALTLTGIGRRAGNLPATPHETT